MRGTAPELRLKFLKRLLTFLLLALQKTRGLAQFFTGRLIATRPWKNALSSGVSETITVVRWFIPKFDHMWHSKMEKFGPFLGRKRWTFPWAVVDQPEGISQFHPPEWAEAGPHRSRRGESAFFIFAQR